MSDNTSPAEPTMNTLCANCGDRHGSHATGTNRCPTDHPNSFFVPAGAAPPLAAQAAPAPLTNERIDAAWNAPDGKRVIAGENQLNWNRALRRAFAREIEAALAAHHSLSRTTRPSNSQREVRNG